MICKNDIFDLKKRRNIYNIILNHPGLHLRDLERKSDIPFTTLKYHVDFLIKNELVDAKNFNGFSRLYATKKVGKMDQILFNAFRQDNLNRILVIFLFCGNKDYFYKKDFKRIPEDENWVNSHNYCLKKHRTTILFHLEKLVKMGIVEKIKINGQVCYKLVDSSMVWDFLIRNQNALSNNRVNILLRYSGKYLGSERIFENIFDIFPHPYHV